MSWNNEQGNGKDKWGQGGDSDGPPDLDELFRRMKRKFNQMNKNGGGGSSKSAKNAGFFGVGFIFALLIAMWAISGIFIVKPPERAVVLRFGKYVRTEMPGPHWIPRFIESVLIVDVENTSSEKYDGAMLTKDENIVSVELSVFFRVADPQAYLFNVVNPLQSLREAMRSALRQVVGSTTLNNILTSGREKAREEAFNNLVQILNRYQTGLEVVNVNLQDVRPPEQVVAAFDDVNKAREDKDRYINQAKAYEKKVTSRVEGRVQQILRKSTADKEQMIAQSNAGVAGYLAVLPEYKRAPTVTRERMYLETIEEILSRSSKVMLDTKGSNNMMYIPLDKLLSLQQQKITDIKPTGEMIEKSPEGPPSLIRRPSKPRSYSTRRGYQWQ